MHIFTDESGGSKGGLFLVSALWIDPPAAKRFIKTVKRNLGIKDEIKGHTLLPEQRQQVFKLLAEMSGACAVAVTCSRETRTGGWAMNKFNEISLWSELTIESCVALPTAGATRLFMTADEGKGERAVLETQRKKIAAAIETRRQDAPVTLNYGKSHLVDGLQIVDIIANTVFQSHSSDSATATRARDLLRPLQEQKQLLIREVELSDYLPEWLAPVAVEI
jgi:hypothetical protein